MDIKTFEKNIKLFDACYKHKLDVIKKLINEGADVNARNEEGSTPLIEICVVDSNLDLAQCLIEHGADLNTINTLNLSALHEACRGNAVRMVKLLLNSGANPHLHDKDFNSLLITAMEFSSAEIVKLLLKAGLDPNNGGKSKKIPLFKAVTAYLDAWQKCDLLLKFGANINATDEFGFNALMMVIKYGENIVISPIVECLIQHGINVTAVDKDGRSALDHLNARKEISKKNRTNITKLIKEALN